MAEVATTLGAEMFMSQFMAGPVASAGGAGAASGGWSALQGAGTAASAISSILGGMAGFSSHRQQAQFARLNADAEFTSAEQKANEIERERLKKVGDARVAFAASGQLTDGASDIENSLNTEADYNTRLLRAGAKAAAAGKRAQANSFDLQGVSSLVSGVSRAAAAGGNYALDLRRRG